MSKKNAKGAVATAIHVTKLGLRVILPVAILAAGWVGYTTVRSWKKPPRKRNRPPKHVTVQVVPLARTHFDVTVRSRGIVKPRNQARLAAEVNGRIVKVHPSFLDGGFFRAGDVLVEIDAQTYELELVRLTREREQADAAVSEVEDERRLAEARIALAERQYRLQLVERDRVKALEAKGTRSRGALDVAEREVLAAEQRWVELRDANAIRSSRVKRLEAARDLVDAKLAQARYELTRTKVRAPYDGRVLRREADEGQYVARGAHLATIYRVDVAEVRLPLTGRQLRFVDLPVRFRGPGDSGDADATSHQRGAHPDVALIAEFGGASHRWKGRIVRTEGEIDSASRQLFVIAQVPDPYGETKSGRPPLRVGTFVFAEIAGKRLEDVHVIPRSALRGAREAHVVREGRLYRRRLEILWQDRAQVVVGSGFEPGDRLCLTPVVFAGQSIPVRVEGEGRAEQGGRGTGARGQ